RAFSRGTSRPRLRDRSRALPRRAQEPGATPRSARLREAVSRPAPARDPATPREPEDGGRRRDPDRDAAPGTAGGARRAGVFAPLAQPPAGSHGGAVEPGFAPRAHHAPARPLHPRRTA